MPSERSLRSSSWRGRSAVASQSPATRVASAPASASDFMHENLPTMIPLLIGTGICLAYFLACQAAVRGSSLVVRAWAPLPRNADPAPYEAW